MADIDALIDEAIREADEVFTVPRMAAELVEQFLADNHDEFLVWLEDHAVAIVGEEIGHRIARLSVGPKRPVQTKARRFAKDAANGPTAVGSWYERAYVIDSKQSRKRACDMTGADHRFVATNYVKSSNTARMLAAFHEAVAKRVKPAQRTSEVMDEATYLALRSSILKDAAA